MRHRLPAVLLAAALSLDSFVADADAPASASGLVPSAVTAAASESARPDFDALDWAWPVESFRLVHRYLAPAHRYGPGHRGIDLAVFGTAEVRSPAAGTVRFSGHVVDRDVVTIDHGDGLVTTFEPVTAGVAEGERVARGQVIGTIGRGGHAAPGSVHMGVRLEGEYINPLLLLGGVPRAVLLPCCD